METPQGKSDVLVLGATGFTGRLITKYLASHTQKALFSLALGARSPSKLQVLVDEYKIADKVKLVEVNVSDLESVERAIQSTRIVINAVGPFYTWGTPVVASCVRNGVHYVDLTGETFWIKKIIRDFDYAATKTGAIIVPSCGFDSIPSDITAWLANRTLKRYVAANQAGTQFVGLASSISAMKHNGGVSGGSMATMMTFFDVPENESREASAPYSTSPVVGGEHPPLKLVYELVIPALRTIVGTFWVMGISNTRLVQRTFGLLEARALEANEISSDEERAEIDEARYGPQFHYDEFLEAPSKFSALISSVTLLVAFTLLKFFSPLRAVAKKYGVQPGSGPSEEEMEKGYFEIANLSTSASSPPIKVQTLITGKGDPGYILTAIMISESALSLLLPQQSTPESVAKISTPDVRRITPFAKKGGILTPMTAFGEELITRLSKTQKFTFRSSVIEENTPNRAAGLSSEYRGERRKDI